MGVDGFVNRLKNMKRTAKPDLVKRIPCVCCEGMYFRPQVVEFNKPIQAQIRKHADGAKIRDYNDKTQQVNNYT